MSCGIVVRMKGPVFLELAQARFHLGDVTVEVFGGGDPAQGVQHHRGRFRARPGLLAARISAAAKRHLPQTIRNRDQVDR